jgi:hypothetical protein
VTKKLDSDQAFAGGQQAPLGMLVPAAHEASTDSGLVVLYTARSCHTK